MHTREPKNNCSGAPPKEGRCAGQMTIVNMFAGYGWSRSRNVGEPSEPTANFVLATVPQTVTTWPRWLIASLAETKPTGNIGGGLGVAVGVGVIVTTGVSVAVATGFGSGVATGWGGAGGRDVAAGTSATS